MSSEPLLSSQFCPELQRWLESVTALSCQLIGSAPGANRQLWTSKRLKLLLEHELLIAQPLSPQTQASHGASHPPVLPSPPPLNLLSCLSAPLLLLPPFPLQFFKHEGGGGFSPLLSAPPFFSSPGNTLNHSYNPPKPTPPPPHCYLNLHSNECAIPRPPSNPPLFFSHGGLPWGWGGGKEESSTCTHTISVAKTQQHPPPTHPSCICVFTYVHICRGTQEHGGWQTRGGGGVGWRPNGSQCRKWLVATQTAPESTVITGLIPVFYLHWENTRPLAAGQGQPLPPTNDYAKLFLQGKKIQLQPSWR